MFIKQYILNERIQAKEVRLVGSDGNQVGIVPLSKAKTLAADSNLDLLLISADATPPVCKIVNFGQYKYEQQKKDKLAKKGTRVQVLKELKMSPKISEHDYNVRLRSGERFLKKRYNVKLTIFFKGREMARKEIGHTLIAKYLDDIKDYGAAAGEVSMSPRTLSVVISPCK